MLSSKALRKILFVLYAMLMPVDVWADALSVESSGEAGRISSIPSRSVEVRLEPETAVNGENVVLGDVATIYSKSIRNFKSLSQLSLARFPGDKEEIILPKAYLEARIRESLPPGTDFALHGPVQLVFRKERIGISSAEFGEEIIRQGRAAGLIPEWAEVKVEAVSGFDQLKLWKISRSRIEPAALLPQWKGDLSFKVSETEKTNPALVWVKVRIRWFADAWVAKRQIGILNPLGVEDFSREKVEITSLRENPILATDDLAVTLKSARAKRSLAVGAPLLLSSLERAPDARPGQPLKVVFISESGIRVTTEGALLGSGSIGNEVRAKLRASRKVVTGKLVSGGRMEVSL